MLYQLSYPGKQRRPAKAETLRSLALISEALPRVEGHSNRKGIPSSMSLPVPGPRRTADVDRPNRIPWPPICLASALVAAWLLERIAPLSMMPASQPLHWLGWLAFVVGLGISISGFRYFQFVGTTPNPTGQAAKLASGGIMAFTRNPMYLGMVVSCVGLAFALGSA